VLQDQPIGAGSYVCQTSPEPNFRVDSAIQARPAPSGLQTFAACPLPTGRFSAPFFFCLGFLASRLDRFCSLFATALSPFTFVAGEYAAEAPRFNH